MVPKEGRVLQDKESFGDISRVPDRETISGWPKIPNRIRRASDRVVLYS